MKQISSFLDKFKNILISDDEIKNNICLVIKDITSEKIEKSDIKIFRNTLYLTTTPQLKNEIFIKKDIILEKIKPLVKNKKIKDIR